EERDRTELKLHSRQAYTFKENRPLQETNCNNCRARYGVAGQRSRNSLALEPAAQSDVIIGGWLFGAETALQSSDLRKELIIEVVIVEKGLQANGIVPLAREVVGMLDAVDNFAKTRYLAEASHYCNRWEDGILGVVNIRRRIQHPLVVV